MTRALRTALIALLAFAACATLPATAQPEGGSAYSQDELDQLLAPVALYPDDLLMQVLMAATYPLEVVEAARFVRQNPGLAGEALDQAVAQRHWDPSVQSLTAFPQVLGMLDDRIEWTQRLGDAFLADQARVMATVQNLRRRAEEAGNLQSTPQQSVIEEAGAILIAPVQPEVIYVPVYDPLYVFGPWWAPAYPPWFWYPPPFYGYPVVIVGVAFGHPCHVSRDHWGWTHVDWHHRHVAIDGGHSRFWNRPGHPPPSAGEPWAHSPGHRRGIAYPNAATRDRYLRIDPSAVRARQQFRGYDLRAPGAHASSGPGTPGGSSAPQPPKPPAPPPSRIVRPAPSAPQPLPQQRVSPFDPGVSRQQAEANAQRGVQSRQSMGAPAAPAGRASAPPAGRATAPPPGRAPSPPSAPRGGHPPR